MENYFIKQLQSYSNTPSVYKINRLYVKCMKIGKHKMAANLKQKYPFAFKGDDLSDAMAFTLFNS